MRLHEVMQPGWGDSANYFRERDMKCGKAKLKILAVVKAQTDKVTAIPAPTLFRELMETIEIVPG